MKEPTIPSEYADKIYTILVKELSANDEGHNRQSFIFAQERGCTEYRFGGILGFGGKFWNNNKWYVNCYSKHETKATIKKMDKVNEMIDILYKEWSNSVHTP